MSYVLGTGPIFLGKKSICRSRTIHNNKRKGESRTSWCRIWH